MMCVAGVAEMSYAQQRCFSQPWLHNGRHFPVMLSAVITCCYVLCCTKRVRACVCLHAIPVSLCGTCMQAALFLPVAAHLRSPGFLPVKPGAFQEVRNPILSVVGSGMLLLFRSQCAHPPSLPFKCSSGEVHCSSVTVPSFVPSFQRSSYTNP